MKDINRDTSIDWYIYYFSNISMYGILKIERSYRVSVNAWNECE